MEEGLYHTIPWLLNTADDRVEYIGAIHTYRFSVQTAEPELIQQLQEQHLESHTTRYRILPSARLTQRDWGLSLQRANRRHP